MYCIGISRLLRQKNRSQSDRRQPRDNTLPSANRRKDSLMTRVPFWHMGAAIAGYGALGFALVGPPDAFASDVFFAHMIQHLLLIMAAAPLLLVSGPIASYLWAMPLIARKRVGATIRQSGRLRRLIRQATAPRLALTLFVFTIWLWHIPTLYDLALENEVIHLMEHGTMFLVSLLFWWPIIGPAPVRSRLTYPQRIVYLLLAVTPNAALGALITLLPPLYPYYASTPSHWGLTTGEDQRIGGLLMWIPGNLIFLLTLSVLFFKWFEQEERNSMPPVNSGSGR